MGHHDYANSALVDADWAQEHLSDPNVRFVEVDVDTTAYEQSHLRGAVGWNWTASSPMGSVATSRRRRTWASSCRRAGSAPTRSSCTATTTTGSPPGRTG